VAIAEVKEELSTSWSTIFAVTKAAEKLFDLSVALALKPKILR
jgi:hypothetical protein